MAKKRVKRKPTYKQMAFETAVRNPERYKGILTAISPYMNRILNNETLLQVVASMYLNRFVTSEGVEITENSTVESISEAVKSVNITRKADGGFPEGYPSRFWTYVRTLSEMGFVLAQYEQPLQFSEIALRLINNEIDEQEAFSLQAMKYNRKSPYRNVSNDFNYFRFILEVLKQRERISYEQFIISTFSKDGNVEEFFRIIDNNTFNHFVEVETFLRKEYGTNLKGQTILRDYPDVVLRLLIITGFISIQFRGKVFIYRNIANDDYINELLSVSIDLSEAEKELSTLHFKKLETYNNVLLRVVYKHRHELIEQDGFEYAKKVAEIIRLYELNEDKIIESIRHIGTTKNVVPAFKYIAEPLKLEFYLSLILALKYGNRFAIRPNYKADYIGLPISHAPGNTGDIEVYSNKLYWLIEVTLIRNKTQQLNSETTSVLRHFLEGNKAYLEKYLSFVAPFIHQDTKEFYDYSIVRHKIKNQNLNIKPYSIDEFVEVTQLGKNFEDMKNYTKSVIEEFRNNLS
jgi:small nuclear ribonucleoprotein (snRNP)-like protein